MTRPASEATRDVRRHDSPRDRRRDHSSTTAGASPAGDVAVIGGLTFDPPNRRAKARMREDDTVTVSPKIAVLC